LQGILVRTLEGHGHWVTTLSLNVDYALRTGAFDRHGNIGEGDRDAADDATIQAAAQAKYNQIIGKGTELLVSGSDDFTLYLWEPIKAKKPIIRMTGHQQPITQVSFSPDGNTIASCSFDRSVKLWQGASGKYINSLRSHVEAVYQIAWSGDSRLCVSASKDSTIKVWDVRTQKRLFELPGHADEVYAVDWAPDGDRVVSGSKDRTIKVWSK
jgi:ribosome assembly protein 4